MSKHHTKALLHRPTPVFGTNAVRSARRVFCQEQQRINWQISLENLGVLRSGLPASRADSRGKAPTKNKQQRGHSLVS